MSMKERDAKAYLVISSIHLGASHKILAVLKSVASFYSAKTFHLGRTVTPEEKDMHDRRINRIRTWEKEAKEKTASVEAWVKYETGKCEAEIDELKNAKRKAKTREEKADLQDDIDDLQDKFDIRIMKYKQKHLLKNKSLQGCQDEVDMVFAAQQLRVKTLNDYFPGISFVVNDEICLPGINSVEGVQVVKNTVYLSRHLFASAVPANGEKISNTPITKRSMDFYKQKGKSWIAPHPIPAAESFPREGLNQAYNYVTTGSLRSLEEPMRPSDYYKCAHLPGAVLVIVDTQNDEFHLKQLHIDYRWDNVSHRSVPVILDDGIMFTPRGHTLVSEDDKGTHVTDDHAPAHHVGVLAAYRALNELHRPSVIFNGSDACDFKSVCHHNKNKPAKLEGLRLRQDLAALRDLLTAQSNVDSIKNRILLDANHHQWLSFFVQENPCLIGILDWETLQKEMFADWKIIIRDIPGETRIVRFGDIVIRHGDQEKSVVDASNIFGKYLGGHYHRYRAYRRAISAGPGCKPDQDYLENKITGWQNQITSLTKIDNVAAASPKIVLHDEKRQVSRFAYRNKIYEVKFYK